MERMDKQTNTKIRNSETYEKMFLKALEKMVFFLGLVLL